MNKSKLLGLAGITLALLGLGCVPAKSTKGKERELTVTIITIDDWLKQGIEVDAGNFSLRFGYNVGKTYASDTTIVSPNDTRHSFNRLSAWASYYIERGNFEKAGENLKNLEELFGKYIQNKKIQVARMTLYNIFSEFYLRQYEKTKSKAFLDSANICIQKVFDENKKKYLEVEDSDSPPKSIEEEMGNEMQKAYDNLGLIYSE